MSNSQDKPANPPLAIVGIGCMFPKAGSVAEYWTNVREGVDAISEVPGTHWKPSDYFAADPAQPDMTYARRGGFIDPVKFDPLLYGMSPNNIEATDTTQLLGMVAAREALLDAGYATGRDSNDGRPFDRDRTSVILGVTGTLELVIPLGARLGHPLWRRALQEAGVDTATANDVVERIAAGYVPWQENSFPGLLGNVAAGRIANRFDLGGTNCVVDAACASSLSAIHMAAMELYAGRTDMAITGGVDTFNDIFMYMCFSKTPALSPTGNSRPFDKDGDGTILGEGIGVLVIKRLDDARRDNDRIYAVIKSIGSSSDGKGNAIYAPSARGQQKALRNAYQLADVRPRSIELVEAHGTGTRVGDAVESEALSAVYREDQADGSWCAIGSVKSMIGHTKAAAGVAGLIKVALALQHKVLPPTIKVGQPLAALLPGQAPVYVNTVKRPWPGNPSHPRRAAVSAFGFGGSNFHAVLEEAAARAETIDWDGRVLIAACSGADKNALAGALAALQDAADWPALRRAAAQSLCDFDPAAACRLLLVFEKDKTDVAKLVSDTRLQLDKPETEMQLPAGAYFGSGSAPGKLALMFPGQGSQYTGMLRDLACQFPQLLQALETANQVLGADADGRRLSDCIYPVPVFDDAARQQQELDLRRTTTAQPAIGVVSHGAAAILKHFGVRADMVAGHSFGELTALSQAGCFNDTGLYRLARRRGELMQAGEGERGGMLAVIASSEQLYQIIEEQQLDLIIANHNAPRQLVLSGASAQIDKAEQVLQERKIRATRLPVAAAFHSSFVAGAEKPFAEFINTVAFESPGVPVFANSTAEPYPADTRQARALLAGQLAKPVEFVNLVQNLYEAGVRTFVEAGPGAVITGLVGAILEDREHVAVAVDRSRGKRSGQYDLALLLAQLAAVGHVRDLRQWDAGYLDGLREERPAGMSIPISGANYVMPREPKPPRPRTVAAAPTTPAPAPGAVVPVVTRAPAATDMQAGTALQTIQQGILVLQQLQQQTAELHRQYLEGQEQAQRSIQQLIEQQHHLLSGEPLAVPAPPPMAATPRVAAAAPAVTPRVETPAPAVAPETDPAADYRNVLLEVVADKTGYPMEMLSLDMSLDTDLGIDSIKRVEILSALQEKLPGIQRIQPEDLGTFQLLQHIVEYLTDGSRDTSVTAETAAPAADDGRFQQALLAVVADKTGYPVEMLSLDMSLDSDLGIDSIKRVEILSALQERLPDAPAVRPEDLGRLQTLGEIVAFMSAPGEAATAAAEPATAAAADSGRFQQALLAVVADKTGYPVEMLNLDMQLDSDLGIDSIKRVEILSALQDRLPDAPAVRPEDLGRLQTLGEIVRFMHAGTAPAIPATPAPAAAPGAGEQTDNNRDTLVYLGRITLQPLQAGGRAVIEPVPGARFLVVDDGTELPAKLVQAFAAQDVGAEVVNLDTPVSGTVHGLVVPVPEVVPDGFIPAAFRLIQQAGGEHLQVLASVSRLGGGFGFRDLSDAAAEAAALHGITKTADKEWPHVHCKAIDIPARRASQKLATAIVAECLTRGPLEAAPAGDEPCETTLQFEEFDTAGPVRNPFVPGDVVVISGGARGVTAEVAVELATQFKVNLLLLGRSPVPLAEPAWMQGLAEEAVIKKAIICQQAADQQLTPRAVEDEYRRLMANREILANLERIRASGVTVQYHAVDTRHAGPLQDIIHTARQEMGPIAGVIHGAGVLADSLIRDKTMDQFNRVYSTKVDGLRALLQATRDDDLKCLVMFSSSTARYGRKGQVDYAAANEVLNKIAQQQQQQRPRCRVLSVNWGPWAGGMVTPQLRKVFESEGVGLIPLRAGARFLARALATPGDVEVVLLGATPPEALPAASGSGAAGVMQLAFERSLSRGNYPVLDHHVMNGCPVLPTALITQWLAHGAMHNNPGLTFIGFDDFRILKGVVVDSGDPVHLQVQAGTGVIRDDRDLVTVELRGDAHVHARATVVLGMQYEQPLQSVMPLPAGDYPYRHQEYYRNGQLFHGPLLQGIVAVEACSEQGIIGSVQTSPPPSAWSCNPIRSSWVADPLVLDCCFQLMILWSFRHSNRGSLPTAIRSYRQYRRAYPAGPLRVIARVEKAAEHQAIANIEVLDQQGELVARLDGYECVIDESLNEAFRRNQPILES